MTVGLSAITAWSVFAVRGQSARPVSLLVTGGTVVTMDGTGRVIPNGAVAIDHDAIVDIGPADELGRRYEGANRVDARGQLVMPGLINAHTHAPMVLFRGLADDLALQDWLEKDIFPAEAKTVSPDFVRVGTRLAALEMIESGTTTFADMYYFEDDVAQVVHEAGLRAVLGQSVIRFPVADAPTPADALRRAEAFIIKWQDDPLITPGVAPHAPHTVDAPTLQAARALANRYGVPLLIHLAETQDEVKAVQAAHHLSPTAYLDSLGIWNGRSLAAHAVWLDDSDMTLLAKKGVGVVTQSCEQHEARERYRRRAEVAEHTACWPASAPTAPPAATTWTCSKPCAWRRSCRRWPRWIPGRCRPRRPSRSRRAAAPTRSAWVRPSAASKIGKQADLITIAMDDARQTPVFDPVSHVVYVCHGDDVRTTIVAGRVLMRGRTRAHARQRRSAA